MPIVEYWSPPQPIASPLARSVKSVAPKPCSAQWRVERPIRFATGPRCGAPRWSGTRLVVPDAVHEPEVVLDQLPAGQAGGLDQLTGTPWRGSHRGPLRRWRPSGAVRVDGSRVRGGHDGLHPADGRRLAGVVTDARGVGVDEHLAVGLGDLPDRGVQPLLDVVAEVRDVTLRDGERRLTQLEADDVSGRSAG